MKLNNTAWPGSFRSRGVVGDVGCKEGEEGCCGEVVVGTCCSAVLSTAACGRKCSMATAVILLSANRATPVLMLCMGEETDHEMKNKNIKRNKDKDKDKIKIKINKSERLLFGWVLF